MDRLRRQISEESSRTAVLVRYQRGCFVITGEKPRSLPATRKGCSSMIRSWFVVTRGPGEYEGESRVSVAHLILCSPIRVAPCECKSDKVEVGER